MLLRTKAGVAAILAVLAIGTAIAASLPFLNPRTPTYPDREMRPDCPPFPKNPEPRVPSPPAIDPLPLTTIAKDWQSYPGNPAGARLIGDEATWRAVWCRTFGRNSVPALPSIDFANSTVVAAYLGERPSSGYEVTIHRAFAFSAGLVVLIQTHEPEPGFGYFQVRTEPFHLAQVPGRWSNATFEWTRVLRNVSFDVAPAAAGLGRNVTIRLENDRRFPSLEVDLSNMTLPSNAPWVVERSEGGGWVRVEDHPMDTTPRTLGPGENASWTWTAIDASATGLSPVVAGLYRVRLSVVLSGTTFELAELFRIY